MSTVVWPISKKPPTQIHSDEKEAHLDSAHNWLLPAMSKKKECYEFFMNKKVILGNLIAEYQTAELNKERLKEIKKPLHFLQGLSKSSAYSLVVICYTNINKKFK